MKGTTATAASSFRRAGTHNNDAEFRPATGRRPRPIGASGGVLDNDVRRQSGLRSPDRGAVVCLTTDTVSAELRELPGRDAFTSSLCSQHRSSTDGLPGLANVTGHGTSSCR